MDTHATLRAARAAFDARDRDTVADLLGTLLASKAALASQWDTVARMASAIGEVSLAIAAHHEHIAAAPGDFSRQLLLGSTLVRYGHLEAAARLGQELVQHATVQAEAQHFLGEILAQTGDSESALRWLQRSVELQPRAAATWLTIATIKNFSPDDPDLQRLRALRSDARLSPPARGILLYALGKALDDIGDTVGAFSAIAEGARFIRLARNYDRSSDARLLEQTITHLDARFFQRLHPSASDATPIFIVGMPRSGSTLIEHILAAHSQVGAGAELGSFRQAAMALPDFLPASIQAFDSRSGDAWTHLAHTYDHLLAERFGRRGRIVDKSLIQAKYLGIIAHTFPRARFIWMRRDPLATAWSCFRTHFGVGQNWSWSLTDIAHYSRFMDRLHEHWRGQFADRILTIPYEEFVRNPEAWIPQVLAHLGLNDESGTRGAHARPRAVQTASTAQVRRPIDAGAADRWRIYEPLLEEFTAAYASPAS